METNFYDIVCVGGGLAGSAVAVRMAQAGASVLVLEKTRTFNDRVRGEWLAPWGVEEARALGLGEVFAEAGAHQLPQLAGRSLRPRLVQSPRGEVALTFSHPALQEALLARAVASGAKVIRGAKVTGLATRGRAEIAFDSPTGAGQVAARLAVGADGRMSLARRVLAREEFVHRSARTLAGVRLANVSGDDSVGYFIFSEDAGGLVSHFPQGGGLARAYVFERGSDAAAYAGPQGVSRFIEAMIRMGVPRDSLAGVTAAGPLSAFVTSDTWVRHPAGDHLALVGDAAGISDPTWGMGTALLLRDARVLTDLLVSRRDWRSAAHAYARRRDAYFRTVTTAESWMTEIQLTPGPTAAARRAFLMSLWGREPNRAIDLPGRALATDISENGRRRTFGEDLVSWLPDPEQPIDVGRGEHGERLTFLHESVKRSSSPAA